MADTPEIGDLESLAIETLRYILVNGSDDKLKTQVAEDVLDRLPKTAKRALPGQINGRRQTNLFIAAGNGGTDLMKGLGSFLAAVSSDGTDTDQGESADDQPLPAPRALTVAPVSIPDPDDPMEARLRAEGILDNGS